MWKDVKNKKDLPDDGEFVLIKCHGMSGSNKFTLMVARFFDNEWYSFFPFDQPVNPTHWCYSISLDDINSIEYQKANIEKLKKGVFIGSTNG